MTTESCVYHSHDARVVYVLLRVVYITLMMRILSLSSCVYHSQNALSECTHRNALQHTDCNTTHPMRPSTLRMRVHLSSDMRPRSHSVRCVAVSVLQCVAVRCSVLQCVAVC